MFDCPASPRCNFGAVAVDVGKNGKDWTVESMAKILRKAGTDLVVIAVDYEGSEDSQVHGELVDHVVSHCHVSGGSYLILGRAITPRWKQFSIQESPVMCRGDLAFLCNNKARSETLEAWAFSAYPSMAPRDFDDVFSTEFVDILRTYAQEQAVYSMMATAFPADLEEDEQEEHQQHYDSDLRNVVRQREKDLSEQTFLDNADVAGLTPLDGQAGLPQRVRVAVRRLHRQFGHVPNGVLTQILRASRVSKEFINAVKLYRCTWCEDSKSRRSSHPAVSMPESYSFNHTLGVDLVEIADAVGNKYIALNMVDMGTCFQLCEVIRSGTGQASAALCLEVLQKRWLSSAGYPTVVVIEGYLTAHGVSVHHAPLRTPEAIGRVKPRITGET